MSFPSEAADGEQTCITVTAICDDIVEGTEAVTVTIPSSAMYVRNDNGADFTLFQPIYFIDGSG